MDVWEDDTVCIHCNSQCWVEGDDCQDRRVNKTRVEDTMDGFFVRLLILDDIRESKKTGSAGNVTPANNSDSPDRISITTSARYCYCKYCYDIAIVYQETCDK